MKGWRWMSGKFLVAVAADGIMQASSNSQPLRVCDWPYVWAFLFCFSKHKSCMKIEKTCGVLKENGFHINWAE